MFIKTIFKKMILRHINEKWGKYNSCMLQLKCWEGCGDWWVPHTAWGLCVCSHHSPQLDARNWWILVWPIMPWIIFIYNKLDTSTSPRFLCDISGVFCVVKCHRVLCSASTEDTHTKSLRPQAIWQNTNIQEDVRRTNIKDSVEPCSNYYGTVHGSIWACPQCL